ncbi:hypothetical protein J422_03823 [Methanocaldococcus villosus KIN24-T80]|uniref:UPF0305 protein J422_03823 n=1 Tax=Methanocaldococcus villosus KIN24-T80 TaxID=1069083 RepID=N6VQJ6_9EURY|nr:DUF2115 domain-containing protein [Methanocaldococcus villosus]ENN96155.1 hypothetical protein J422_03823 [Methanocaldococcus villosus KIN24-T80]
MKAKELLKKLKEKAENFSIYDIIAIKCFIEKDAKYLPEKYKEDYINAMIKYYIDTLNEIKSKEICEDYEIDEKKLNELINRIESFKKYNSEEEKKFIELSKIICPYLLFIAKKPFHPEYLIFPGGLKIIKDNNIYYCPVKEKQLNEYSLCEFCVAKPI